MTVNVRYMVDDVDAAVAFYTKHLGFAHLSSPETSSSFSSRDGRNRLAREQSAREDPTDQSTNCGGKLPDCSVRTTSPARSTVNDHVWWRSPVAGSVARWNCRASHVSVKVTMKPDPVADSSVRHVPGTTMPGGGPPPCIWPTLTPAALGKVLEMANPQDSDAKTARRASPAPNVCPVAAA